MLSSFRYNLVLGIFIGLIGLLLSMGQTAVAQGIYIRTFVPGNYLGDNRHRVVIANKSDYTYNLSGFMLVTRDYSVLLPEDRRLQPQSQLVLGKKQQGHAMQLDIELSQTPNFLIRFYSKKVDGNYVVLFNRQGQVVDAMYHSKLPNVPFLPASDTLITQNNRIQPYELPPESSPVWGYFPFGTDPAVGFRQVAPDQWEVIPANPNTRLEAKITFKDFKARYEDGVVTLKWTTATEQKVRYIEVQRGRDQRHYKTIGKLEARSSSSNEPQSYTFYDSDVQQDSTYYYRLKNVNRVNEADYSKVTEVTIEELPVEFWLELYPQRTASAQQVSIRFFSAYSQHIKIKLLDQHFREVGLLFNNLVYADTQHLLKLNEELDKGHYLIVAYTDQKRYFKTLRVK